MPLGQPIILTMVLVLFAWQMDSLWQHGFLDHGKDIPGSVFFVQILMIMAKLGVKQRFLLIPKMPLILILLLF